MLLSFSPFSAVPKTPKKARLLAATAKHSSEWLNAMPITTYGLALSNEELRISVCLRHGLPLFRSHQCTCGETVDELGQHCFTCKPNSGKQARHHAINQLIHSEWTRSLSPSLCVCAHMPLIRITRCHARRAQADIREHRKGKRERELDSVGMVLKTSRLHKNSLKPNNTTEK